MLNQKLKLIVILFFLLKNYSEGGPKERKIRGKGKSDATADHQESPINYHEQQSQGSASFPEGGSSAAPSFTLTTPKICEWNRCGQAFDDEAEFFQHVKGHANSSQSVNIRDRCGTGSRAGFCGIPSPNPALFSICRILRDAGFLRNLSRGIPSLRDFKKNPACGIPQTRFYRFLELICRWTGCERNEKPFNSQRHFFEHLPAHTGEKRYACDFVAKNGVRCTNRYASQSNLKRHQHFHVGQRIKGSITQYTSNQLL
uniref:C2H2-type domain-containing protein n=1 Tax=Meloidogyne incognita TaxID=6306 RepID=A0A914MK61_MELIC